MGESSANAPHEPGESGVTRRRFLGTALGGGRAILTGGSSLIFGTASNAATNAGADSIFELGGDLPVNPLGFGAMRITGDGVWGWPPNRDEARKVLRRAVEQGMVSKLTSQFPSTTAAVPPSFETPWNVMRVVPSRVLRSSAAVQAASRNT